MTPQALFQLIEANVVDYDSQTAAQLADAINKHEDVRDNATPITAAELMGRLPTSEARLLLGTLQEAAVLDPLVSSALATLQGKGLDLSNPLVRQMLPTLAANHHDKWPDGLVEKILDFGRTRTRLVPVSEPVTEEDVANALQWHTNHQRLTGNYNAAFDALEGGKDWSEIESLLTREVA